MTDTLKLGGLEIAQYIKILKAENKRQREFIEFHQSQGQLYEITIARLEGENKRLRDVLEDIESMASSPQWRNEPMSRILPLIETAPLSKHIGETK